MNDNSFTAWANPLTEYQRRYQDAWQSFAPQPDAGGFDGGAANTANPWVSALEQWCKSAQPGTAPPVQDFYARLVDQAKVYLQMTDSFSKTFQQASAAGDSIAQWQEAVNDTLAGLKAVFGGHKPYIQGGAQQAIAFWELPLNTWRHAMSSSSILPGDFLQSVSALGVGQVRDELHGRVDQLLSTPAIGYMREDQEQTRILIKLIIDYQQALQDYAATYGEIGVKCVDALQEHLQERLAEGKPIDSLREMYDLWVDGCEQAYGEYVNSDKYVEIYGRLVNGLMALKRHGTMMVDEALGAMNMPTRSEVDTLHRRLQEARREGKALRAELESLKQRREETESLRQLQAEVESLVRRSQMKPKQEEAASAKSATAKPKRAAAKRKTGAPKSATRSPTKKKSRAKRDRSSKSRS